MGKLVIFVVSTVLVFVVLAVVVFLAADYLFNREVDKEVEEFYMGVENHHQVIREADLNRLPAAVQNWLRYAQVIGKEKIVAARTKQKVELRLEQDKPRMPAKAEQYFRTEEPGFIWKVKINAAPFFHIVGRDKYCDGHGNMLIKIMSIKTIADARGPEIDQGTLLRYLAETMWFPTAALSDYIKWEEIDTQLIINSDIELATIYLTFRTQAFF